MPSDGVHSWTLCLVSDRRMAELNRRYRGKTGPTDVLSFPNLPNDDEVVPPTEEERELGDVVIAIETAERQAQQQGHSLRRELEVLSIHGYLHLSGYDHETDNGEMMQLQQELVGELCGAQS